MTRITVILLTLLASNPALAGAFKFTDSNGIIHYSNKPIKKTDKPIVVSAGATSYFYKYIGPNGVILFTDSPRSNYKLISKTRVERPKNYLASLSAALNHQPHFYTGANKSKFNDLIEQTALKHQVDAKLVHAVIQTESAYNSTAVSRAGAVGLMQLMPETARRFGVMDRNDPDQNVDGGTRYLKHLITLFDSNLELAIAAYNSGENAVMKYNNSIPPYSETQNYVKQVLALYNH